MKNNTFKQKYPGSLFGFDTAAVLFFLAVEYSRNLSPASVDGALFAITMGMVLVLPYFLPSTSLRASFGSWMISRSMLMFAGLLFGAALGAGTGVLPGSARFMPMTFLVLAAMVSCYIQFYSLFKLRPVK